MPFGKKTSGVQKDGSNQIPSTSDLQSCNPSIHQPINPSTNQRINQLHSLKLTFSPLKIDGWNTTFLLGFGPFSGAMLVSGRVINQAIQFKPTNSIQFKSNPRQGSERHFVLLSFVRSVAEGWALQNLNMQGSENEIRVTLTARVVGILEDPRTCKWLGSPPIYKP